MATRTDQKKNSQQIATSGYTSYFKFTVLHNMTIVYWPWNNSVKDMGQVSVSQLVFQSRNMKMFFNIGILYFFHYRINTYEFENDKNDIFDWKNNEWNCGSSAPTRNGSIWRYLFPKKKSTLLPYHFCYISVTLFFGRMEG